MRPKREELVEKRRLVSRAGLKLAEAAEDFCYDFRGKVVLDLGSSTGGFTEYALRKGARKVIAVEIGTRQMREELRRDERVELFEKTDLFQFVPEREEKIEVILADISFVSLTKVLKYAKMKLARRNTDFLVMLKPQFEAEERELARGVVKNENYRRQIIHRFEQWLKREGFLILKKRDNSLKGRNGNKERFYLLKMGDGSILR